MSHPSSEPMMQGDVSIRPLTTDDVPFVLQLHALDHVREFLDGPSEDQIRGALEREAPAQLIIESAGRPAGLILLDFHDDWLVELRRLAVAVPNRGIGSAAMRWVLTDAFEKRGANRVNLEVAARNEHARRLYERYGFVHEGTFREGYRNHSTGEFEDLCVYGLLRREFRVT